jgi:subtilase family serine protease
MLVSQCISLSVSIVSSSVAIRLRRIVASTFVLAIFCVALLCAPLPAQQASQGTTVSPLITQALITQEIDESQLTTLTGNTYPLARPQFDLGSAPASLPMERMLLVLKHGEAQHAEMIRLLDEQQDKSSPNFHKWLTPDQFGKQFGPTDSDMQIITAWLQSHGFTVGSTKGRTALEFSGSASQVEEAFHTPIHKYVVNGEQHWANARDPQIPTALVPAVAGIVSLHNFPRRAANQFVGTYSEKTKRLTPPIPSSGIGLDTYGTCGNQSCYAVSPYDFATIYDVLPLWNAGTTGTGQTIAIVGRTNINPSDPPTFWQLFNLPVPANKLNIILNGPDPGINGDEAEADIDIQWSGAVAPQAAIDFVTSASTNTADGIDLSAVYIIENNLAPVMSESYGECELGLGTAGNQFYSAIWSQAAAQGISVFVSSGDNGSAGCDNPGGPAEYGLNVNGLASTPFNAAIGGTDFNEYNTWSTYWNSTNDSTTQESAKGYIPETTWNDSCTNSLAVTLGFGSTAEQACNNYQMQEEGGVNSTGGSGGPSNCAVNTTTGGSVGTCSAGYIKPSWQTGTGITNNVRDLPDVSLFASNGFLGSFYVICQSDASGGVCDLDDLPGYGGTSVASPAFAGILSLVNQKTGTPQGVPGFYLYQLVSKQANAFHDVPSGSTNAMPCVTGSLNCVTTTTGDTYGVLSGYTTGTGYDLATGLGTVDAANLVNNWNKATFTSTTATLQLNNGAAVNVTHGTAVPVSIGINPTAATGQAALLVSTGSGTTTGQDIDVFPLSGGTASKSTSLLPGGTYNVIAHYGGDGTYGGSYSTSVSVTVAKENSTIVLPGLQVNGSAATTVSYDAQYFVQATVENSQGVACNPPPFGEITCPTGNIAFTDNGNALGTGPYTLDNTATAETTGQAFTLTGGAHTLAAQYNGDNNYNTGSASVAVTVTQANTTTAAPSFQASDFKNVQLSTLVQDPNAVANLAAPSGQVTFYSNGTLLAGTVTYNAYGYGTSAGLQATFPGPGTYNITAKYSGDQNYLGSTSPATSALLQYPQPVITLTPASQTVQSGGTASVTALVDSGNMTYYPTGTVTFVANGATVSGPTTCTNATDSTGHFSCQVAATFTVNSTETVIANYSGDTNYPASSQGTTISVPDFSLIVNGNTGENVTVTQGQSQTVPINITALAGFSGTVSFSYSGLPGETTGSFSPSQVTGGSGSTTMTISTAAVGQSRRHLAQAGRGTGWFASAALLMLSACLIGIPSWRRRGALPMLLIVALFVTMPGCGGGAPGGTPPPPNNPTPTIAALSPTQQAAGSQSQILTINGTGFISTSTVTYNATPHQPTFASSTSLSIALSGSDLATAGSYPVVVTNPSPGGGPSGSVSFGVVSGTPTGNFTITVTATSGTLTHTAQFTLTVQ